LTPLPRAELPVSDNFVYLNHAATGVIPRCTRRAIEEFVAAQSEKGVMGSFPYEVRMPEFRGRVASFIGANVDEIAIVRNTSEATNVLALGIDWEPGDEIILPDDEFPANAIPWLALRSRGVGIRFIESAKEHMTPDVLRRAITPRTRVVAVSWVSYHDGYRHDLAALAEIAHKSGAIFCVDAIQGLGVFPVDVHGEGVDAFYGGGQKWMLALQGVAYLYVSSALREKLTVAVPGWRSVRDMWDFFPLKYEQPYAEDASRFEGGTPNFVGALALATSAEFLAGYDRAAVASHVLALTDYLVEGLHRAGAEVLTPRGPGISSAIVTFNLPDCDPIELGKALQCEGIVVTYRPNGIRVSPHGYNTFEEIDALSEAIKRTESPARAVPS
jgi:cysteine desulfurase/selenocysteine lyase